MNRKKSLGFISLITAAFVWGTSFVAQSLGMEKIDAFTFIGIRSIIGVLFLIPVIIIKDLITNKNKSPEELKEQKVINIKNYKKGIILGILLCIATNLQQYAFYYSTAGKIAFITSFYIILVPVLSLFIKKKATLLTWICTIIGIIGMFFITIDFKDGFSVNIGDLYALGCALFFAIHIIVIDLFIKDGDGLRLSATQFLVCGIITIILMFIFEKPNIPDILAVKWTLIYSGVMSSGIAYTCQILGQKHVETNVATLVLSLESVFAAISSAIILGEKMTTTSIFGCIILFTAIILPSVINIIKNKKMLYSNK